MSQVFIRTSAKAFARFAVRPSVGIVRTVSFTHRTAFQCRFFSSEEGKGTSDAVTPSSGSDGEGEGDKEGDEEEEGEVSESDALAAALADDDGVREPDVGQAGDDEEPMPAADEEEQFVEEEFIDDYDMDDDEIDRLMRKSGNEGYITRQEYKSGEPEYLVADEEEFDEEFIAGLKLPYLDELTKQMIYEKHQTDPEKYTAKVLSQIYKASVERTEAVIFLMRIREETIQREEEQLFEIAAHEKVFGILGDYSKELEKFEADQPEELLDPEEAIIEKKKQVKKKIVLPTLDKEGVAKKLGEKHSLPVDKVKLIMNHLDYFLKRTQDVADYEAYMDTKIELMEDNGIINAGIFQESPSVTDTKKKAIEETYFPRLFFDEEQEAEKKALLQRIAKETKGKLKASLQHYVDDEEKRKLDAPPTHIDPAAMELALSLKPSRFKFALRDTSLSNKYKRTTICTRQGQLRWATPLEEARRSWSDRPTQMNFLNNKKILEKYNDFDKDDYLMLELAKAKRARRQAFVAEVAAKNAS